MRDSYPDELRALELRMRAVLYEDGVARRAGVIARVSAARGLSGVDAPLGVHRARRRSASASVLVVSSALLAVLVAVIALTLGHRSASQRGESTAPGATELLGKLAVLRRPQTAVDRTLPNHVASHSRFRTQQTIISGLTRLAQVLATPGGPVRIYLIVETPAPGYPPFPPPWSPRLGDQVSALTTKIRPGGKSGGGGTGGGGGKPASALTDPSDVARSGYVNESIVPDGVTRVKWVYDGNYNGHVNHPQAVTIYPTVRNNVAASLVVRNQGLLSSATWYGPSGKAIASYNAARFLAHVNAIDRELLQRACAGLPTASHPASPLTAPSKRPLTIRDICAKLGKPTAVSGTPSETRVNRQVWEYSRKLGVYETLPVPGTNILISLPAPPRHRHR